MLKRVAVLVGGSSRCSIAIDGSRSGKGENAVQRSSSDKTRFFHAKSLFFHPHQLCDESNVRTHARPLRQDMLVGLVQRPMKFRDQVGNRCCYRPRLACLTMDVDGRVP